MPRHQPFKVIRQSVFQKYFSSESKKQLNENKLDCNLICAGGFGEKVEICDIAFIVFVLVYQIHLFSPTMLSRDTTLNAFKHYECFQYDTNARNVPILHYVATETHIRQSKVEKNVNF